MANGNNYFASPFAAFGIGMFAFATLIGIISLQNKIILQKKGLEFSILLLYYWDTSCFHAAVVNYPKPTFTGLINHPAAL